MRASGGAEEITNGRRSGGRHPPSPSLWRTGNHAGHPPSPRLRWTRNHKPLISRMARIRTGRIKPFETCCKYRCWRAERSEGENKERLLPADNGADVRRWETKNSDSFFICVNLRHLRAIPDLVAAGRAVPLVFGKGQFESGVAAMMLREFAQDPFP